MASLDHWVSLSSGSLLGGDLQTEFGWQGSMISCLLYGKLKAELVVAVKRNYAAASGATGGHELPTR